MVITDEGADKAEAKGKGPEPMQMGALRRIHTMEASTEKEEGKSMYVDTEIAGQTIRALVDTGSTHTYIRDDVAKELGLKWRKVDAMMKAVNTDPTPFVGISHDVKLRVGEWKGKVDMQVSKLDDYALVFGLEFLEKIKAVPMPFANTMCIYDKGGCTVPIVREESKQALLSAMRLIKGHHNGYGKPTLKTGVKPEGSGGVAKVHINGAKARQARWESKQSAKT
ncbi:uncharacterized protein [Rutidosis leptorrhynchoides]|uniref:uncharacterized protein n=1 Tax=Rutidosis leptorrhynchoides TaxID=125765 RepID=UPI003A997C9D